MIIYRHHNNILTSAIMVTLFIVLMVIIVITITRSIIIGITAWNPVQELRLSPLTLDYLALFVDPGTLNRQHFCQGSYWMPTDFCRSGQFCLFIIRYWRSFGTICKSTGVPDLHRWHSPTHSTMKVVIHGSSRVGLLSFRYNDSISLHRGSIKVHWELFVGWDWRYGDPLHAEKGDPVNRDRSKPGLVKDHPRMQLQLHNALLLQFTRPHAPLSLSLEQDRKTRRYRYCCLTPEHSPVELTDYLECFLKMVLTYFRHNRSMGES